MREGQVQDVWSAAKRHCQLASKKQTGKIGNVKVVVPAAGSDSGLEVAWEDVMFVVCGLSSDSDDDGCESAKTSEEEAKPAPNPIDIKLEKNGNDQY